jgi:hypothetical protein
MEDDPHLLNVQVTVKGGAPCPPPGASEASAALVRHLTPHAPPTQRPREISYGSPWDQPVKRGWTLGARGAGVTGADRAASRTETVFAPWLATTRSRWPFPRSPTATDDGLDPTP